MNKTPLYFAGEPPIIDTGVSFPEGSYWPSELGLNMPEVDQINIGLCTVDGAPEDVWHWHNYAHAHPGVRLGHPKFPFRVEWEEFRIICLSHGGFVYEKPGKVSQIMIHEYCHILAGPGAGWEKPKGHGPLWAAQMARFGLYPWITGPYVCR